MNTHIHQLYEKTTEGKDVWECIAEEGELKVYKREMEVDGVVLDPLKAVHTVTVSVNYSPCMVYSNIQQFLYNLWRSKEK